MTGLAIVIPALNEERTIAGVVTSVSSVGTVYVVDDGSTDATAQRARTAGACVLSNPRPLGYDAAISSGLNRAFGDGATAAITCDADGQHRAEDVARIAALVCDGSADFATGLRDRYNRPVEAAIGAISRVLYGTRDPFCGLKCYGRTIYERVGDFPRNMNIGTLPLDWVRAYRFEARYLPIRVARRVDRARFGRRVVADLRLCLAFASTVLSRATSRARARRERFDR